MGTLQDSFGVHYSKADLPLQSGKKRYILATEPVHPTGNAFHVSKQILPGVYLETNISRGNIVARISKLLRQRDIPFKVLVGPEA